MICGAIAFTGAVPTRVYGHDIFTYLDNGWRVINGQRPHADYYSAFGPLLFLVNALGLTLSHDSVDGIGYGSAIYALAVGLWSALGAGRLAPAPENRIQPVPHRYRGVSLLAGELCISLRATQ